MEAAVDVEVGVEVEAVEGDLRMAPSTTAMLLPEWGMELPGLQDVQARSEHDDQRNDWPVLVGDRTKEG